MSTPALAATVIAVAATSAAFAGPTFVQDFEGETPGLLNQGTVFNAGPGTTFTVTSSGNNLGLAVYDTNTNVNGDGDLQVFSGNALILQDNQGGIPNDANEGGIINFAFNRPTELISIDLIDIDQRSAMIITMTDNGGNERIFDIPDFFTGDPDRGHPGIQTLDFALNNQIGVGPGNRIATFTDNGFFSLSSVVNVSFDFSGSGAIDNLAVVAIPLPHPAAAATIGLAAIATLRRRR